MVSRASVIDVNYETLLIGGIMKKFFKNRTEAGRLLAEKLKTYANRPDVLVLALPRGGSRVRRWRRAWCSELMQNSQRLCSDSLGTFWKPKVHKPFSDYFTTFSSLPFVSILAFCHFLQAAVEEGIGTALVRLVLVTGCA
jgi:hypothetical protein